MVHDFDIICISESWISESFNKDLLTEYDILGYKKFLYQRHQRQGGGVILYVRNNFNVRNVQNVKVDTHVESVWLDIETVGNIILRVGLFYRSPSPPNGEGNEYIRLLNKKYIDEINRGLNNVGNNIAIILGDFNYSDINWELINASNDLSIEFLECIQDNFLEQVVHEQTRYQNCLDLVLTNHSSIVKNLKILAPIGNSDHNSMSFDIEINIQNSENNKEKYNFKKGNYNKFRQLLTNIDWDLEFRDKNCLEMWEKFKENLEILQDECIPKVTSRSKNSKPKPNWWDTEISNLIKEKNEANSKLIRNGYQVNDLENFRSIREKVKNTIRKKSMQEDIMIGREKNSKKLFTKYKVKSKIKEQINFIKKGDQVYTGDKNIADGFNSFFSSIFNTYSEEDELDIQNEVLVGNTNTIDIFEIEYDTVKKIINTLDINKSMGPDNISTRILKEGVDSISYALTKIYNASLIESQVPLDWKLANVAPIFKKGDKESIGNYRPISLTSIVCRIFEKIMKSNLLEFLDRYKIILKSQHGFTNKRSCLTNLLEYLEYVTNIIDNGDSADIIYLDFSKAFDKVSHRKLIRKLWGYGIRGNVLRWISSWLIGRRQRVVLNGQESDWIDVTSGVPQGSVLGPLLFILYANDLELGINCKVYKFADDTKVAVQVRNWQDNFMGQKDLDRLLGWADKWDMQFNEDKCKILHLGSNNPKFSYNMNGTWLESIEAEKDLGVYIDNKLKFSRQCLEARNKANRMLGFISRNVAHKSKEVIKTLYNAYVRPHLEYCVQAWSPHFQKDLVMLEKVQRRATRLVSGFRRLDYESRLRELDMYSLERRYKRGDMIEVYKIITGLDNLNVGDFFEFDNDGRRGHSKKLKVKYARLDIRKFSFSVRVVNLWNSLSEDTVDSDTLDSFKKLLDRDMTNLGYV